MGLSALTIVLSIVLAVLLIFLISGPEKDTFLKFNKYPLRSYCELSEPCLWDSSRQVTLSNGMEGVCTSHGIACPSFSKDHNKTNFAGLTPDMVSSLYQQIHDAERDR
jgi:hypothetical protein